MTQEQKTILALGMKESEEKDGVPEMYIEIEDIEHFDVQKLIQMLAFTLDVTMQNITITDKETGEEYECEEKLDKILDLAKQMVIHSAREE